MRKNISGFLCLQLSLIVFCFSISAQDFKTVRDGIEYAEYEKQVDNLPVKMNLLRLDLTKVRLDVVHATDAAIRLETTSSIAQRYGAFAAINAGFFRIDRNIYEGDDVSLLMVDGKLLSENSSNRISLFIENERAATQVSLERVNAEISLSFRKTTLPVSGINRERKKDELIIFTPELHRTTLTDNNGLEISVVNGKIVQISDGKGSSVIPPNGFVLSATGKFRGELENLKIGDKLKIADSFKKTSDHTDAFGMRAVEDIVSGVPQLIKDGKIDITWQEEKSSKSFVETKHPRTAVAKLKDGKFLMVTVDGRSEASGGIGLEDLAKILLEMGATDAMNLDGGGSSTMFLDGKIVNHPSDKEGERKIGDAILVTPRK